MTVGTKRLVPPSFTWIRNRKLRYRPSSEHRRWVRHIEHFEKKGERFFVHYERQKSKKDQQARGSKKVHRMSQRKGALALHTREQKLRSLRKSDEYDAKYNEAWLADNLYDADKERALSEADKDSAEENDCGLDNEWDAASIRLEEDFYDAEVESLYAELEAMGIH